MRRTYLIAGVGIVAALLVVTPVLGLPGGLKKAIKKEVAKQIEGTQGPKGDTGPPGATGAPGTPGTNGSPAASAFAGRSSVALSGGADAVEFLAPSGISAPNADDDIVSMPSPNATIVVRDLFVRLANDPGVDLTRSFELFDDGVGTGVSCDIESNATQCNSGALTATVQPGSDLAFEATTTAMGADPSTVRFGFRATTP